MRNKMKSILMMIIFVMTFGLASNTTYAYDYVDVYVTNGTMQSYHDDAQLKNGVTLVPLRGVFETLGASVVWNGKDKSITAKKGTKTVWLKVGSKTAKVNGKALTITAAPIVQEGVTLVPLRFISESLDATVNWDSYNNEVTIDAKGSSHIERSPWLGFYYNKLSGSGVTWELSIDKVTPTTITFTSIHGYRYDPTGGHLSGGEMPWEILHETREAKLVAENVARYNLNGCSFDLKLTWGEIRVENMYGSCDHLNLIEYDGDYTGYEKSFLME